MNRLLSYTYFSTLLLCASLVPMPAAADGISHWQSDFGPLSLKVENDVDVTGTYPDFRGRLDGSLSSDGRLEMTWFQPESEVRCRGKNFGTYYWGYVTWKVMPGGVLKGKWSYCDRTPGSGGQWNAKQVSGAAIEEMVGVHEPLSPSPSADIDHLLIQWDESNSRCRGGSGEDQKTWEACDERDGMGDRLKARGWCYGKPGQFGYQMKWHPCK